MNFLPPYIEWVLWSIWLPILLLIAIFPHIVLVYPRTYLKVIAGSLIVGLVWDYIAVWTRIWEYPPNCCTGVKIYRLPLDEYIWITSAAILISMITIVLRHYLFVEARSKR